MSRRDAVLEEMGLGPVWRLRRGHAAAGPQGIASAPADAGLAAGDAVAAAADPVAASAAPREARILGMGWDELKSAVSSCTTCKLRAGCRQTVFGVGDEGAEWMIIGGGPMFFVGHFFSPM